VRSTAQETLTHGHERGKIGNGVWGKVVELRSEEIQEATKENTRRQGKPAINMGGQKHTLTLFWLGLPLLPRKPRSSVGDQALVGHVEEVILRDGRLDPVSLDPALRQAGSGRGPSAAGGSPLRLLRCRRLLGTLQRRRLLLGHGRR